MRRIWLRLVFDSDANAWFTWEGERLSGGKDICVFKFEVPEVSSTLVLGSPMNSTRVGYHGVIHVDRPSGSVLRLELETDFATIVVDGRAVAFGRTLWADYESRNVGGKEFILPRRAEEVEVLGSVLTKHGISFDKYRRYATNSEIRYGDVKR
jgi:hypothetical protein